MGGLKWLGPRPPVMALGTVAALSYRCPVATIRTVCAHDCPDQCSLIATVENGRIIRVQGDPDHPMTAGFACAKVNREHEMVHSPERIQTPLRRTGKKGAGEFEPVTW